MYPINGACHRIGPDETALAYRTQPSPPVIAGIWPDPAQNEANIQWVRDYYERPHHSRSWAQRLHVRRRPVWIEVNYQENYGRLAETERKYDPGNPFHVNQNVNP